MPMQACTSDHQIQSKIINYAVNNCLTFRRARNPIRFKLPIIGRLLVNLRAASGEHVSEDRNREFELAEPNATIYSQLSAR
jgi:hypothetical protein